MQAPQDQNQNVNMPTHKKEQKVAIIHFWLVQMRGGEKVLEALCRMYPDADIYTHVLDKTKISPYLQSRNIYTTFINRLPFVKKHYQKYLPLMPIALEQLDLSDYDLVISSESGPAKGVLTRSDATHVCYCHSPMRYLWDFYPLYLQNVSRYMRFFMRYFFHGLRQWDVLSAMRVDHFVANSRTVAQRIKKIWRRQASVVHPPVDTVQYPLSTQKREDFYLCVGQLVAYKRVDIAIEACIALKKKLIIVGEGGMRPGYEALIDSLQGREYVQILGRADLEKIQELYASCAALLFPGEEDFGIVPLEAMCTGAPVLAYGKGGATETVIEGETGLFFYEQNSEALCSVMEEFENTRASFDSERIHKHAESFSEERFIKEMFAEIAKAQAETGQQ